MSANPHANGDSLLRDLHLPDFRAYAETVSEPGIRGIGDTRVLAPFLRDVAKLNQEERSVCVWRSHSASLGAPPG